MRRYELPACVRCLREMLCEFSHRVGHEPYLLYFLVSLSLVSLSCVTHHAERKRKRAERTHTHLLYPPVSGLSVRERINVAGHEEKQASDTRRARFLGKAGCHVENGGLSGHYFTVTAASKRCNFYIMRVSDNI